MDDAQNEFQSFELTQKDAYSSNNWQTEVVSLNQLTGKYQSVNQSSLFQTKVHS